MNRREGLHSGAPGEGRDEEARANANLYVVLV